MQRKREELAVQIAGLRGSVATYRELMDLVPEETPAVGLFDEEVPQGTIAEMAADLIERHGGPMKVAEITRQLERVGKFQHGGGDNSARGNYGTVYGTLKRHKLFELTSQGEFGLTQSAEQREQEYERGKPGWSRGPGWTRAESRACEFCTSLRSSPLPFQHSSCEHGSMDELRQRLAELLERVRDVQVRL